MAVAAAAFSLDLLGSSGAAGRARPCYSWWIGGEDEVCVGVSWFGALAGISAVGTLAAEARQRQRQGRRASAKCMRRISCPRRLRAHRSWKTRSLNGSMWWIE